MHFTLFLFPYSDEFWSHTWLNFEYNCFFFNLSLRSIMLFVSNQYLRQTVRKRNRRWRHYLWLFAFTPEQMGKMKSSRKKGRKNTSKYFNKVPTCDRNNYNCWHLLKTSPFNLFGENDTRKLRIQYQNSNNNTNKTAIRNDLRFWYS